MAKRNKCPGSGTRMMLAWPPDKEGYPGAVVCQCSFGVLVRKGTAQPDMSEAEIHGYSGIVRVHYIEKNSESMTYKKS